MEKIFEALNKMGYNFNIGVIDNPFVLFCLSIIVLASVALFCGLNMVIYFIAFFILENETIKSHVSKYSLFVLIMKFYTRSRIIYFFIETGIFFFCLSFIIYLCSKFVYIMS